MWYRLFRSMFYMTFRTLFRWKIEGVSNIPKDGAVILCSNHISLIDPPLLGSPVFHRKVHFMAKYELFNIPVISYFIRQFGAFPVKRGGADRQAIRQGLKILKEGEVLGIFPEGTRSKTGELGKAHTGAAMFALRSNAQVVPVAIIGSYRLFKPLKIVYGKPIDLSSFREEKVNGEVMKQATDKIMSEIQKLIDTSKA